MTTLENKVKIVSTTTYLLQTSDVKFHNKDKSLRGKIIPGQNWIIPRAWLMAKSMTNFAASFLRCALLGTDLLSVNKLEVMEQTPLITLYVCRPMFLKINLAWIAPSLNWGHKVRPVSTVPCQVTKQIVLEMNRKQMSGHTVSYMQLT